MQSERVSFLRNKNVNTGSKSVIFFLECMNINVWTFSLPFLANNLDHQKKGFDSQQKMCSQSPIF